MARTNERYLNSVGIDLGTSTTKVVFSRICVRSRSLGSAVPLVEIFDKQVFYRGKVHLTPLLDDARIDSGRVIELIEAEFHQAGVEPEVVETGAVIITGETARKANAQEILHALAARFGDFVVAMAGPELEAIIAGKGSGAATRSQTCGRRIANVDIGGGTTNIAVFEDGEVLMTRCFRVGGRLVEVEPETLVVRRIREPAALIAKTHGLDLVAGRKAAYVDLERLAAVMAGCVERALNGLPPELWARDLELGEEAALLPPLQEVMFTGGVGACYYDVQTYQRPTRALAFGDVGPLLGRALHRLSAAGFRVVEPEETLRATVLGAGTQTLEVSGSTIYVEDGHLPIRNLPVVRPQGLNGDIGEAALEAGYRKAIRAFDPHGECLPLAYAVPGTNCRGFQEVLSVAAVITKIEQERGCSGPLIVIAEGDCAEALGQTMRVLSSRSRPRPIVCLDQVGVRHGDYVDVGRPLSAGGAVPVVVKSLVLGG